MREQGFEKVANKILAQQSKLGKLQGLSVNVKNLSDSVLTRLVKNGAMAVVPITVAAVYTNKEAMERSAQFFKIQEKRHKDDLEMTKNNYERFKATNAKRDSLEKEYQDEISSMKKDYADRMKIKEKSWEKTRKTNTAVASAAASIPFFVNFIRKGIKQEVLITARYKYGTKVFKVYDASKAEIQSGIDKIIFKSITELVARMKKNAQFPIKEDVTLEEFKQINLTESELETFIEGDIL